MNSVIRICFIMPNAWPLANHTTHQFGGAEINLLNLAREFAADPNYLVHFHVGDYGQNQYEYIDGIRFVKLKFTNYDTNNKKYKHLLYLVISRIIQIFMIIIHSYDVIITSSFGAYLGRIALIKKIKKFRLIFRLAHDLDLDMEYIKSSEGGFSTLLYRYGLFHTDSIIAQTVFQKNKANDTFGLNSIHIRNGFCLSETKSAEEKSHILWVSRGVQVKRYWLFAELARLIPEKQFVMIMPANKKIQDEIMSITSDLPNFRFITHVPFDEIQLWFNRADWFVNTSEAEGFPNTFIQACLGRTPILSWTINPDDILNKYNMGRVCQNKIETAVEFINNSSESEKAIMGMNAYDYVREFHDIKEKKEQYAEIINVALHNN